MTSRVALSAANCTGESRHLPFSDNGPDHHDQRQPRPCIHTRSIWKNTCSKKSRFVTRPVFYMGAIDSDQSNLDILV